MAPAVDNSDLLGAIGIQAVNLEGSTSPPATATLARRGAQVTAADYVPSLLDRAQARAASEVLDIATERADAEALPFPCGRSPRSGTPRRGGTLRVPSDYLEVVAVKAG